MAKRLNQKEAAALEVLRSTGVDVLEAALVAKVALDAGKGSATRAKACVAAGAGLLRQQQKTVSFEQAVNEALKIRQDRRARTQSDFRYICRRLMRRNEGLAHRRVRRMTAQECARCIEIAFDTPRQRHKARQVLSAVFTTAWRRGWCAENPVARIEAPRIVETQVNILQPAEIESLLKAAEKYENGLCLPAAGMMLYAGIRPHEVMRLTWAQVDMQQQAIYIHPRHSKTGGARRVTIHPPLLRILREHNRATDEKICPANWLKHWRDLRRQAGWNSAEHRWQQDSLRHTFASYHLSHFRSYAELQLEIGHRDTTLLRTRYVDQRGVHAADKFWSA